MCAVCNRPHGVQVHHIKPRGEGGSDDISNGIPLCPNCHDETHAQFAPGRTTRRYTEHELRKHLDRTVELATRQGAWVEGSEDWEHDVELLQFYAGCLDRPAFRTYFHQELSFADFDQALEDTVLALNTGFLRTRDGTLIQRADGKRALVNAGWRETMDSVVGQAMLARQALRRGLGLDRMLMELDRHDPWLDRFDRDLRGNTTLGAQIDDHRQRAIDSLNGVLTDAGLPSLKPLGDWS